MCLRSFYVWNLPTLRSLYALRENNVTYIHVTRLYKTSRTGSLTLSNTQLNNIPDHISRHSPLSRRQEKGQATSSTAASHLHSETKRFETSKRLVIVIFSVCSRRVGSSYWEPLPFSPCIIHRKNHPFSTFENIELLVTTAWRVLGLRMVETASRYGA
jgi:hypothetical protein